MTSAAAQQLKASEQKTEDADLVMDIHRMQRDNGFDAAQLVKAVREDYAHLGQARVNRLLEAYARMLERNQ
ncbi:hypothetical protein HNP46_000331 [Pseudomonas nitritireducens]|uniref:Uncharacterized protein n=1 Tax=Pseudomonas nitroreducens TaxID=46680 RepID=A0A7W7KER5_PSENT|nr:hypothetical protein [Pseudomonas nitritireducens]MBB4861520.1 hypothetical protein [Pseudomonas nitritireducens]